jgi:ketosteroid isomerase-like protein
MFYRATLFAVLLFLTNGCRGDAPPPEGRNSEVQSAVSQTFDSLTQAIRSLNVEAMLTYYSTDSSIVRALDDRLVAGRAAVERDFREGFAAVRSIDRLDVMARHLAVLSPESAVLTVQADEAFTDTAGGVTRVRATWTSAWRLQSGHWRIIQDAALHVPVGH